MKVTMKSKICNTCGIEYPLDQFYLIRNKKTGKARRRNHCCFCDNERSRSNYAKHRAKILKQKAERYQDDPWAARLVALIRRCSIGYITIADLKKLVDESGGVCHYCKKQLNGSWTFDHATPVSCGGSNDPENLRVCCMSCNAGKRDLTESEYLLKTTGVPF